MYVGLVEAFSRLPAHLRFFRLSLQVDHLSSIVHSLTANFPRTETCLRVLSLVTSRLVRPVLGPDISPLASTNAERSKYLDVSFWI